MIITLSAGRDWLISPISYCIVLLLPAHIIYFHTTYFFISYRVFFSASLLDSVHRQASACFTPIISHFLHLLIFSQALSFRWQCSLLELPAQSASYFEVPPLLPLRHYYLALPPPMPCHYSSCRFTPHTSHKRETRSSISSLRATTTFLTFLYFCIIIYFHLSLIWWRILLLWYFWWLSRIVICSCRFQDIYFIIFTYIPFTIRRTL